MLKNKAAEERVHKMYRRDIEEKRYDELKKMYGQKKKLARGYGLPILIALAHYPELQDVEIEFTFDKSEHTASSKPIITSVFNSGKARKYQVAISMDASRELRPILMKNLNFNMQIGQMGHELGHIADFIGKNSLEVIGDGMFYFVPAVKKDLEKGTDMIAVKHGFGYQQLEFAHYLDKLRKEYPNEKYYQTYFDYYMTIEEIEEAINRLEIYKS